MSVEHKDLVDFEVYLSDLLKRIEYLENQIALLKNKPDESYLIKTLLAIEQAGKNPDNWRTPHQLQKIARLALEKVGKQFVP